MNIVDKLKEIEEHFATISDSDFEKNLQKAGEVIIQPASKSGFTLV